MTRIEESGIRFAAAGGLVMAMVGTLTLAIAMMPMSPEAYFAPVGLALSVAALAVCLLTLLGSRRAYLLLFTILLVGLSINFRIREVGEVKLDFQSAAKFIGWMVALCVGIWHSRRFVDLAKQPALAGMLIYCIVGIGSAVYSEVPLFSFANALGLLAFCVFAMAGACLIAGRDLIVLCAGGLSTYVLINLGVAFIAPEVGYLAPSETETVYRLQGVAGHPNVLGQQVAVLLATLFVCFDRRWLNRLLIVTMAMITLSVLVMTNSRGNLAAIVVSVGLVLLRRQPVLLIIMVIALLAGLLTLIVMPENIAQSLLGQFSRSGSVSEITTLTGRTELWEFCFRKIAERPLLGYGYMAAEGVISREFVSSSYGSTINAHNMLIQSLLSVGILGTAPIIISIGWLLFAFVSKPDSLRDVFTMLVIFGGITEIEIFGSSAGAYAQVYFCAVSVSTLQALCATKKDQKLLLNPRLDTHVGDGLTNG